VGLLQVELDVEAVSEVTPGDHESSDGAEFAWKVHDALDSWTAKVDTKASIVLAIEAALAGFVITLSSKGGRLSALHGYRVNLDRFGLAFLTASVLLSLAVVWPQLGRRKAKGNWSSNMIYFGHLRRWDPDKLATALAEEALTIPQLARQLVTMSKINWRKHSWLQCSLLCLVVRTGLLAWAGS
jgi:hypothetical protein